MCELAAALAAHKGAGYVVAPAGFGKTYLIAQSTALSDGRQLILTHTYAGVNALRRKMRDLGVSERLYHIDTIASWSLRMSLAYTATSGWQEERPADNARWDALYAAGSQLLDQEFIRRIVRASYAGLYVDEYQDCSTAQHGIVLKLERDLPTRILGDPLQGIFDFEGQNPIDWVRDVEGHFQLLGALEVPHRWVQAGAGDLGAWLAGVRGCLERGEAIDLTRNRPRSVILRQANANPQDLLQSQGNACRHFRCDRGHTVVAIHKGSGEYKSKCHGLARKLSGVYSSIEEVEGKSLFSFIRKVESARTDAARLKVVIAFAKQCMTCVEESLTAGTLRGEHANIRANTKNPKVVQCANEILAASGSAAITSFLLALKEVEGVKVIRSDLFNRALGVLRKHVLSTDTSLSEAAEKYHGEFRYKGRPVGRRRLIGTTLLVKGLEFDHAIVLDAVSLPRKDLYVALTRGARSLTIVTTSTLLTPAD